MSPCGSRPVGGVAGSEDDEMEDLRFGPDGEHVAYNALSTGGHRIVRDGAEIRSSGSPKRAEASISRASPPSGLIVIRRIRS